MCLIFTALIRSEIVSNSNQSITEISFVTEKAQDQPPRLRQPEEVAGMYPHAAIEKRQNRPFVWLKCGNPQNRIPAAFDGKAFKFREGRKLAIEFGKVSSDAALNLLLNLSPLR